MDENQPNTSTPPPPIVGPPPVTQPPLPPPRKSSAWKWVLGCGCLALAGIAFMVVVIAALVGEGVSTHPFGSKVALIYLQGAITSGSSGGLFSAAGASSEDVIHDLKQADEDSAVKAVVLRVNSPGGSAAASQEIYQEVLRVRKDKPVVVSMGDLAASGGYYVSSAANEILADSGTLTGSIGVILESSDMSQLFKKIGIRPETIKSGPHKDMFSPSRPLTDEECAMAKRMILDIYNQFVDDVYAGRKDKGLTRAGLLAIADGRVFTGRQAVAAHLVDRIGTLQDAIEEAGKLGGIKGEPSVWRVKRSFWESFPDTRIDIHPQIIIDPSHGAEGSLSTLRTPGE